VEGTRPQLPPGCLQLRIQLGHIHKNPHPQLQTANIPAAATAIQPSLIIDQVWSNRFYSELLCEISNEKELISYSYQFFFSIHINFHFISPFLEKCSEHCRKITQDENPTNCCQLLSFLAHRAAAKDIGWHASIRSLYQTE